MAYNGQLYELERTAQSNSFNDAQRRQMRQELSLPILNRFRQWLEAKGADVLPKSPISKAIGYLLNKIGPS